jgi:hypothetical protein
MDGLKVVPNYLKSRTRAEVKFPCRIALQTNRAVSSKYKTMCAKLKGEQKLAQQRVEKILSFLIETSRIKPHLSLSFLRLAPPVCLREHVRKAKWKTKRIVRDFALIRLQDEALEELRATCCFLRLHFVLLGAHVPLLTQTMLWSFSNS